MSGPKVSWYSLDENGQRIVIEQMNCETTSLLYAEQIKDLLKEIPSLKDKMDKSIYIVKNVIDDEEKKKESLDYITSIQEMLDKNLADIDHDIKNNMPKVSHKFVVSEGALANKRKQLEIVSAIRDRILKIKESVDLSIDLGAKAFKAKESSTIETITDYLTEDECGVNNIFDEDITVIKERISNDISGVFSFDVPNSDNESKTEQRKSLVISALARLKEKALSQEIYTEIDNAISKLTTINDEGFLTTFESITVKNLIQKCNDYSDEQKRRQVEIDNLYSKYAILCNMLGEKIVEKQFFDSVESLKDSVQELEKLFVKTQEQSYISECIDTVMSEMGYNVIGSREVTKKNGTRFRNELFTYGEGTAVNVTFSSDGKIAMELGGLDTTDRLPNERETTELCEQMESFCGDFKEIEKRLAAKGVVLADRVSLMPPKAEYAQIINTDDYNITGEVSNLRTKKRQTSTGSNKSMKVDN